MVKDGLSRCFVKQTDVNLQIQYPKNVRNIFYICSAEFRHTYYDESVPLLSLIGNLVNFKVDRVSNRHSSLGVSYTIHKYIAAGVGYCLLSTGLPEPPIDKAINLTLSLSTFYCSRGWERKPCLRWNYSHMIISLRNLRYWRCNLRVFFVEAMKS